MKTYLVSLPQPANTLPCQDALSLIGTDDGRCWLGLGPRLTGPEPPYRGLVNSASIIRRRSCNAFTVASAGAMMLFSKLANKCSR